MKVKKKRLEEIMRDKDDIDLLKDLFRRQNELSKAFGDDFSKMTLEQKEQYTKDKVLALLDEIHEVLRETNWKSWKKEKKEINKDHLLTELSDVFHFYINLCLAWGFTADDVYDAYVKKDDENYERIKSKY